MHVRGAVLIDGVYVIENVLVLLDTGALSANYMGRSFYLQHQAVLEPFTFVVEKSVRLGGSSSVKSITMGINLQICLENILGYDIKGGTVLDIQCYIFDSDVDLIIGLPTLVSTAHDYFLAVFERAASRKIHDSLCYHLENTPQNPEINDINQLVRPFLEHTFEAPEDLETPHPVMFSDALHFLSMDREEAIKEYFALFPTHVTKEFAEATDIINYLTKVAVKIFVPDNWDGVNGMEPIELVWKTTPQKQRIKARPINPKLFQHAIVELKRLMQYHLLPSDSEVMSTMVVAPKATPPFIRICGNYVTINLHLAIQYFMIPDVKKELPRIFGFKYFIDLDMTNAFHQIPLAKTSSEYLSIVTPLGVFRPRFVPEGIGPATAILQRTVTSIFSDFNEFMIVLFDNFLLLGHSYTDLFDKFVRITERCIERNVHLKFSKSWFGVKKVDFFGYEVVHNSYRLSDKRTAALQAMPFPPNKKRMQSFLGSALFFKDFLPHYSTLAAPLYEMVSDKFDWIDQTTWTKDYEAHYSSFLQALSNSFTLYYPNYDLDWILRTDASDVGVGSVLFQVCNGQFQPIQFHAKKFSPQARRWSTYDKEGYAVYFGVFSNDYFLRCKPFTLETDHRNLLYMGTSKVPRVMRWFMYLQSFVITYRHVAGKMNLTADLLSRSFDLSPQETAELNQIEQTAEGLSAYDMLREVHGGREGHCGEKRTWEKLKTRFPDHGIPFATVCDFIKQCSICQKDRFEQKPSIPAAPTVLRAPHHRSCVAADGLKVAMDRFGYDHLIVVVNLHTKFAILYPAKDYEAETTATCLFQYFCTFGLFEELRTDLGSDYTSKVVGFLMDWLGIRRTYAMVNNPQADGVEGTNKQVLRHLKAICWDERVKDRWSSPTVLPIVQLIINESVSSESGVIPLHATFGDRDAIYFNIPATIPLSDITDKYVEELADNFQVIRSISAKYQEKLKEERLKDPLAVSRNKFQRGDFVLLLLEKSKLTDKLTPRNRGPYEVIGHEEYRVEVRDIINGNICHFNQNDLKLFVGTPEEAFSAAQLDNDQHVVSKIIGHAGDIDERSKMEFYILYADGDKRWLPLDKDINTSIYFESYCRSRSYLLPLLQTAVKANKNRIQCNKVDIHLVEPGVKVFVDIRFFGAAWYNAIPLPGKYEKQFVLRATYGKFCGKPRLKSHIEIVFHETNELFTFDNWTVNLWGNQQLLGPGQVLITKEMVQEYHLYPQTPTSKEKK